MRRLPPAVDAAGKHLSPVTVSPNHMLFCNFLFTCALICPTGKLLSRLDLRVGSLRLKNLQADSSDDSTGTSRTLDLFVEHLTRAHTHAQQLAAGGASASSASDSDTVTDTAAHRVLLLSALKLAIRRIDADVVDNAVFSFFKARLLPDVPLPEWLLTATIRDRWGGLATPERALGHVAAQDGDTHHVQVVPEHAVKPYSQKARLRKSVPLLANLRLVGNRQSMPNWRMLQRVLGAYDKVPRRARRRMSLYGLGPSPGPEDPWLDSRAVYYCSPEYILKFRTTMTGHYEIQSSDNAAPRRAAAAAFSGAQTSSLTHFTAIGGIFANPISGRARPDLVRELSCGVAQYLVPPDAPGVLDWGCTTFNTCVRGEPCAFPPDRRTLPHDYTAFKAIKSIAVPFNGTLHDAAVKLSGYLNFNVSVLSPITGAPEGEVLMGWLYAQLRQDMVDVCHLYGALNSVSSPCLPIRPTVIVVGDGNGGVLREATGLRAHSKQFYPSQWDASGTHLRPVQMHPWPPLPLNSLVRVEQLQVQLHLQSRALCQQKHPGWYNQLPEGDADRVFYQGDVGSEIVMYANMDAGITRIWRASLREGHPMYAKHYSPFASTTDARTHVDALRRILVHDPLHAPMHNDMVIIKSILLPHRLVASLEQTRVLLRLPFLNWDSEGKQYRTKKRMLRIYGAASLMVHMRRFHTQEGWLIGVRLQPPAIDASAGSFPGYDEESYRDQFLKMIESTNRDGMLHVLNHLTLDLILPWKLDQRAKAHGLTEVQQLLRKVWIPWLQQGERGHFHVIRHMFRQLLSPFTRSERRSMVAFMNSAPSLSGTFGKSIEMDAIQELYVLFIVLGR